ncbi:hypothetical protein [Dictyobacter formicarum]|uniref:LisH domain-containing protein n=1 Tax=Dictyobacter formicarum TaxID=2778368 RepID=A0ABQ3VNI9_9CHLR|nr:hypothetical protein [Dictyobacter formicarum]GHO87807.1 hypothetical protein KSZ_58130 [Dictyobacter formicarum]
MRDMQPPNGFTDQPKHSARKLETKHYSPGTNKDQLMLDYLLDSGFQWEEAVTLLNLREHLYENAEMRQRITEDYRMHFVKWLYEHGLVNDSF